ncbi:8461_t:CDS:2, partial [Paraglomus brasilianum]
WWHRSIQGKLFQATSKHMCAYCTLEITHNHEYELSLGLHLARSKSMGLGLLLTGNASPPEQLYGFELSSFVPSSHAGVNCVQWSHDNVKVIRFYNKSKCVIFGGSNKISHIWDRTESQYDEPLKARPSECNNRHDLNIDKILVVSASDIEDIVGVSNLTV